jgi:hypothetical protein
MNEKTKLKHLIRVTYFESIVCFTISMFCLISIGFLQVI